MNLSDLLHDVRLSFTPASQASFGNLDEATSIALTAAIVQAVPFLWMVSIQGIDDHTAPRFDPLKPGLRSGRKALRTRQRNRRMLPPPKTAGSAKPLTKSMMSRPKGALSGSGVPKPWRA